MERKVNKWKNEGEMLKLLRYRQVYPEFANFVEHQCQFTEYFIKRLNLECELKGHQGCVNCLEWSSDGRHLASGSDDTNVIYWDPFRHKKSEVIPTPHTGNIFSVKFLDTNDSVIATAAGDYRVIVQNMNEAISKGTPLLQCSCHIGRVKRLATCPNQTMLFWSAGEDGIVLQYDMREPHDCRITSRVFIELGYGTEIKCIQVNPTNPNYIAIGANDSFIRMYDRRKIKITLEKLKDRGPLESNKRSSSDLKDPNCVQYYSPGHLAKEDVNPMSFKVAATYIAFNSAGTEMLVNIGGEQIYLFDVNSAERIEEIIIPQNISSKKSSLHHPGCRSNDTTGKPVIGDHLNSTCLCKYLVTADQLLQRNWVGDTYAAAREYICIVHSCPEEPNAYLGLIKCLIKLKWPNEANDWMNTFLSKFPKMASMNEVNGLLQEIRQMGLGRGIEMKIDPQEKLFRKNCLDYKKRFLGHCNTTTDIKEVNFLGQEGNYLCAGSDEGVIFIWNKHTTEIVTALWGDVSIVNCIQPHPSVCFIASSGIDPVVKLWSPSSEHYQTNTRIVRDLPTVIEDNQHRMSVDPFESMFSNIGYRFLNQYVDEILDLSHFSPNRTN